MRGFRNELNKFNNTGARMLDSIYHITLNCLISHCWGQFVKILTPFTRRYIGRH